MLDLNHTFSALADPTRRAILSRLAHGDATVGELAEPFDISLPAVSRHLKVLEDARLIVRRREGQYMRCRLLAKALEPASDWLSAYARFWSGTLDRLNEHLKKDDPHGEP